MIIKSVDSNIDSVLDTRKIEYDVEIIIGGLSLAIYAARNKYISFCRSNRL